MVGLADQAAALAEAAIHATLVGDLDDQAVWITPGDRRNGAGVFFIHRVEDAFRIELVDGGNRLAADRTIRIGRIDQGQVIRRDRKTVALADLDQLIQSIGVQRQEVCQFFD